jgi:hypothetical protein
MIIAIQTNQLGSIWMEDFPKRLCAFYDLGAMGRPIADAL